MLIFLPNQNLTQSAREHCNAHLNKLLLEGAQILCTVAHLQGVTMPYKPTHQNHPLVKWVQLSSTNFNFILEYIIKLEEERKLRFFKSNYHKSYEMLLQNVIQLDKVTGTLPNINLDLSTFPKPKGFELYPIHEAFQHYFKQTKRHLADWGWRGVPGWYN